MTAFLKPHEGRIYAGFRIITGFLFLQHGLQKCFGLLGGDQADNPVMWVAGSIELLAGTAIAIGFQARWAAFLASGMMAVAYFTMHAPNGFWPVANRGELAVLYCWAFLLIATRGSGIWSVDAATGRS
jgi:putative oxidoreductase